TLKFDPGSKCVFTRGLETMDMPIRHAEGRFFTPDRSLLTDLERRHCIPCRYVDPRSGRPTMKFPHNPNGSQKAIAGLCTPNGRVFGLMPHPEAFLFPENHPQWLRHKLDGKLPEHGDGLKIFKNAVNFLQKC
ncbi:MAG: phosphoribosylformylglycinamidine synthase subunit PurQ, partial [Lentisphaerae bacterium]|nr:phosphoribosylformylglycinamidine synthase subunit PurQ [Lentisphaerota bacterium]